MTFSPFNPNVPIPNNPFYSPESAYLTGPSGPLIVGSGFSINNITGVIDVSGGGSGAPTILPGVGISVVSGVGTVTIANTGILTLTAGSGISVSGSGSNRIITNTAPAPSVIGTVSSVSTGTGLVGGPITSTGTISLAPVGTVAPGTYTNATITVDIYGRVTFAAPGSGLGSLLQATAPLSVNASIPQTISISNASTAASGAVQLNSSTNSTSITQAATPSAVKTAFDLATTATTNSATALSAATSAVTTAGNAQITANNALSTANAAQTAANTAQTTANSALVNASAAQVTANAAIPSSSFTVKGQVLAATGPSTFVALNSGVNGQVLVACSTCASGLTWLSQPSVPGTVTSVATGIGLTGGTITTTGTIALSTSGVSAGTYTNTTVAVDTFGRVTAASTGAPPIPNACIIGKGALVTGLGVSTPVALPVGADNRVLTACSACPSGLTWAPGGGGGSGSVTSVATGTGLTGGPITSTGTITLANTAVTPGAYTSANITIDAQGRITAAANGSGGSVTSVTGTAPIVSSGGTTPAISLANTAVTPGAYTLANITIDAQGRITAAANGSAGGVGTVTSITAGTGLSGGTITAAGTIDLANTAVSAGAYTNASITVDPQGRLTAASSGLAPLTALTGTSPIAVTAGTTPVVSIASSSTTAPGAVQLYDNTNSTSTALALTAAQGKNLQDQITALANASNLELAGTIDASTGLVVSVTSSGVAAGYTVGAVLPAASATTNNTYVIVTEPGTLTPPGGSATPTTRGDYFLVSETSPGVYAWTFLNVGFDAPAATTSVAGIVCLSTNALAQAGVDTLTALTPAAASSAFIPRTCITAKGGLISGTAANTPTALSVGTDGQALLACAACTSGLTWATPAVAVLPATPTVAGTVLGCTTGVFTAVGCGSLQVNTAQRNTAVGFCASAANTTGDGNTAIGHASQINNTTGVYNTAVGACTMAVNTTGSFNAAVGRNALFSNTIGCYNIGIGNNAGCNISTGSNNVAIGYGAQVASAIGDCQLAIGTGVNSWLTGDCTFAIKPGAGISDCAGTTGTNGQVLMSNGSNAICWGTAGGGSVSSTGGGYVDNAITRYDGTTGSLIQNSLVTVNDSGAINAPNNTGSMIPFYYASQASFPAASTSHGAIAHSHSDGKMYYAHGGVWIELANDNEIIPDTILTAKGQLIVATAASTPVALPVGANATVLTADSTCASGIKWAAGGTVTSITAGTGLTGGTISASGTIALDTTCVIAPSALSSKGALLTATATATPIALGSGSNGQVLTVNTLCSANLEWVTPSSGASAATPTVAGIVLGCTTASISALGCNALSSNTTGVNNTANGFNALLCNTAGNGNTANGVVALVCNTTGFNNTANGVNALYFNTTGTSNTANGVDALLSNTTGNCNTSLGYQAGSAITTGCLNVAIGTNSAVASDTASCQLAIGFSATCNWLTGDSSKNIQPGAGIKDCTASVGTAGQILSSTGTAIAWVTAVPIMVGSWVFAGTNKSVGLGATTTAPTPGTTSVDAVYYRQLGDKEWEVSYIFSATGSWVNGGNGDYLFTLPNDLQFDYTLPFQPAFQGNVGSFNYSSNFYTLKGPCSGSTSYSNNANASVYNIPGAIIWDATRWRFMSTADFQNGLRAIGSSYWGGDSRTQWNIRFQFTSLV